MIQYAGFADGWWPRVRLPYILSGNVEPRILRATDLAVVAEFGKRGFQHGWLRENEALITEELGSDDRQLYSLNVTGKVTILQPRFPSQRGVTTDGQGRIYCFTTHGAYVDFQRKNTTRYLPQSATSDGRGVVLAVKNEPGTRICIARPRCTCRLSVTRSLLPGKSGPPSCTGGLRFNRLP